MLSLLMMCSIVIDDVFHRYPRRGEGTTGSEQLMWRIISQGRQVLVAGRVIVQVGLVHSTVPVVEVVPRKSLTVVHTCTKDVITCTVLWQYSTYIKKKAAEVHRKRYTTFFLCASQSTDTNRVTNQNSSLPQLLSIVDYFNCCCIQILMSEEVDYF